MNRTCARPLHRDEVHVASPCEARWDEMVGDAQVRRCGLCDKDVHDLSAMTARGARRLLATTSAPCVRYGTRPDGTVIHRRESRRARAAAFLAALVVAAPAYASGAPAAELELPTTLAELQERVSDWLRPPPVPEPPPVAVVAGGIGPRPPPPPVTMGRPLPVEPAPPPPVRPTSPPPRTIPELDAAR